MDCSSFRYNRELISRSYAYNYGGYQKNYAHFGIFINEIPVGSFQLKRIDVVNQCCEFGIILQNDSLKNKGIGTLAIKEGMKIAFYDYHINTITGETMGRNKRMIRVFEKLGFHLEEIVPEAYILPDGHKENRLVYKKKITEAIHEC